VVRRGPGSTLWRHRVVSALIGFMVELNETTRGLTRRQVVAWPLSTGVGGLGACAGSPPAPPRAVDAALPSLAEAFGRKMPIGMAIRPEQLRGGAETALIDRHFNVVVAENVMKAESLAPQAEGRYDFAPADTLVNWARARGKLVRGHTLVWHHQNPAWMFRDGAEPASRAVLITRLQRYIGDVVRHFKGRVYAWDVVNESYIFDEGPGSQADANGMRLSEWRRLIGPDYIEIAFRAAAQADPDALLFYNDYETQNPRKVEAISRLVRDFKARGIKIDGVGHQAHCAAGHPSVAQFERAIDAYARLGVTQHVTELDIALNEGVMETKVTQATPALLERQARRYGELVSLFLRKREQVTALLVWGLTDADTWLTSWPVKRFEAPLLFDAQLRPKPAFFAVLEAARRAG
jgi:endo-1,4-beta-xylanase